jgi:hypothetical protein
MRHSPFTIEEGPHEIAPEETGQATTQSGYLILIRIHIRSISP